MIPLRKLGLILSASVCCLIWFSIRPVRFTQYLKAEDPEESDYKYILAWTPDFPNVKLLGWSYPEVDGFQQAGCERRGIAGVAAEKGVVQRQAGQVRGGQRGEEEHGLAGEGEREDV